MAGTAGFELDRADASLGTPPGTVILARSENHPDHFVAVPEALLSHVRTLSGGSPAALIRAEMSYSELPGGGAIFAVGSITFCGSLPVNGFDNPLSRLLDNLLRRWQGNGD